LPKLPKKPKSEWLLKRQEAEVEKKEAEKSVEKSPESYGLEERPEHDVVIIPIFWRNIEGQEEAMVKESNRIKSILHNVGGLDVWVDRTHKRTPGQKLNFWEQQGVRWRIEIGPKEAIKYRCVVSHQAGKAGDYTTVTKLPNVSTVKRSQLLAKLRTGLSLEKIPEEALLVSVNDPEGDAKQTVLADENLRCFLHPAGDGKVARGDGGLGGDDVKGLGDSKDAEKKSDFVAPLSWRAATPAARSAPVPVAKAPKVKESAEGLAAAKAPNAKERRALRRAAETAAAGGAATPEE
jgi:hypothetical protein